MLEIKKGQTINLDKKPEAPALRIVYDDKSVPFKYAYVAGKVTGLPNYREIFKKAVDKLESIGCICMNPAELPEGFPWEAYMPICYAMIDACEVVYLLKNWRDSRGAVMEYEYAVGHGKLIILEELEE